MPDGANAYPAYNIFLIVAYVGPISVSAIGRFLSSLFFHFPPLTVSASGVFLEPNA
jgi:hypothetical protein